MHATPLDRPACRRRAARRRRWLLAALVALGTLALAAGVDAPDAAQAGSLMARHA